MKLAAVCCHFNPAGYRKRVQNYDAFRRHVEAAGVPLLTVELVFGDSSHELHGGNNLRFRSDSVMWHKERLLNLGAERLATDYDAIAWFDADVEFAARDWPARILRALDSHDVAQCFHVIHQRYYGGGITQNSFAARLGRGERPVTAPRVTGVAWAVRSDAFTSGLKLYEYALIGGGDVVFARACQAAAWGWDADHMDLWQNVNTVRWTGPAYRDHCRRWMGSVIPLLRGGVGCANLAARTMPHGRASRRRYVERHRRLEGLNPSEDVRINVDGVFEWTTTKLAMHARIHRYFFERDEDE